MNDELRSEDNIREIIGNSVTYLNTHYPESNLSSEHTAELEKYAWAETLDALELDERTSIGYTYKALGAGLWALRQAMVFHPYATPTSSASPQVTSSSTLPATTSAHPSETFTRLITQLTMAAGDADTNCAVAGPLIGAWFGYRNLPTEWERELKHREWLLEKADAAGKLLGLSMESPTADPGEASADLSENADVGPGHGSPYDWEGDTDTLIDAGKGSMSKEEIDAVWAVLIENMHSRQGKEIPEAFKPRSKGGKDGDGCIVC
jgi:hypothetical protein